MPWRATGYFSGPRHRASKISHAFGGIGISRNIGGFDGPNRDFRGADVVVCVCGVDILRALGSGHVSLAENRARPPASISALGLSRAARAFRGRRNCVDAEYLGRASGALDDWAGDDTFRAVI